MAKPSDHPTLDDMPWEFPDTPTTEGFNKSNDALPDADPRTYAALGLDTQIVRRNAPLSLGYMVRRGGMMCSEYHYRWELVAEDFAWRIEHGRVR